MVEPRRIAEVLGGRQVLRRRVASIIELSDAVAQGLPKSALRNAVRRIFEDAAEQRRMMYRIVPEATFKRRRDRLSSAESERTERLARVIATAEYVWEDRDSARRFLTTPHPMLAGKAPLNAAMTELGARQVEDLLAKILHGLPS
jgi:putative toxin-antitoxin system antitoxin component (TIGR02293 family)